DTSRFSSPTERKWGRRNEPYVAEYEMRTFPCGELVENLRQRLQEIRVRRKSVKQGKFARPVSRFRIFDAATPRECEAFETLLNTAYQAFRWIHEFQDPFTPEHEDLLREYATVGASTLCILRTLNRSKFQKDYPDPELWEQGCAVLRAVNEAVSGEIPYSRLEGCISETLISRNASTLRKLDQRQSASRLRNRLRELLRDIAEREELTESGSGIKTENQAEIGDVTEIAYREFTRNPRNIEKSEKIESPILRSDREIWAEIVQVTTELGMKFAEAWDSEFLMSQFQPFWEEMPTFVEEAEETEGAEVDSVSVTETVVLATPFFLRVLASLEDQNAQQEQVFGETETLDSEIAQRLGPDELELVLKVRRAFQGTRMVFIGGVPQVGTRRRFERFFGVELVWEECKHHYGFDRFRAWIRSSDVSCFLVKKAWCSHAHNQELVHEILQAGKKCVRLGNENYPIPIARRIVEQCLQEEM
ncbi:MAG: hypothetical protein Q4C70_09305, partial [Planctomycetia bacterium]|nr:hypothetical protein [Planctomycetia bacterium]